MHLSIYIYTYLYLPDPLKITGFLPNTGFYIEPFKKKGLALKTSGFGKYMIIHEITIYMSSFPRLHQAQGAADAWDQAAGGAAQDLIAVNIPNI